MNLRVCIYYLLFVISFRVVFIIVISTTCIEASSDRNSFPIEFRKIVANPTFCLSLLEFSVLCHIIQKTSFSLSVFHITEWYTVMFIFIFWSNLKFCIFRVICSSKVSFASTCILIPSLCMLLFGSSWGGVAVQPLTSSHNLFYTYNEVSCSLLSICDQLLLLRCLMLSLFLLSFLLWVLTCSVYRLWPMATT